MASSAVTDTIRGMKRRGPITLLLTNRTFRSLALVAMLPACYFGLYYFLLERKLYVQTGVDPASGQNLFYCVPQYRNSEIESVMRPALWIDRHVRSDYWTTIEKSNGMKWKNPPVSNP